MPRFWGMYAMLGSLTSVSLACEAMNAKRAMSSQAAVGMEWLPWPQERA